MADADRIEVERLWEGYRGRAKRRRLPWRGPVHWALRDVTVSVAEGEMLGVIGRNGSGKTTLLQVVSGVIPPTRGRVRVRGRTASLVELSAGFHRDLTGHENLLLGGIMLGLSRRQILRRYDDIVAFAGLDDDALSAPFSTYSAGMGLRLGFSLVAHAEADVLAVDEVLAVGDEAFQIACLRRIDELLDAGGTVLLVSHDLDLVAKRCDRVLVLHEGEPHFLGDVAEALERYHVLNRPDYHP